MRCMRGCHKLGLTLSDGVFCSDVVRSRRAEAEAPEAIKDPPFPRADLSSLADVFVTFWTLGIRSSLLCISWGS